MGSVSAIVGLFLIPAEPFVGSPTNLLFATTARAAPHRPEVNVPARLKQFFETMKSLSSRAAAPYAARIIPENPKADLTRLLTHVGVEGIEFINLTNDGSTREHPTTTRRMTRDQLATQVQRRRGEQLLWLMELAHFLKWWSDRPTTVESPDKTTLLVTFTDDYILTFRELTDHLQLVKVEYLRDPDGGD